MTARSNPVIVVPTLLDSVQKSKYGFFAARVKMSAGPAIDSACG